MKNLRGQRIAVVGAGAVGLFYGGLLARAGYDVSFLLRSDLEVVRSRGLVLHTRGERLQFPVKSAGDPGDIGPVDLVLIAIKATANEVLEGLIPPLLGPETRLLTLQNGLGNEEFLSSRWGAERVMGALCYVCLNRIGQGEVLHVDTGSISVGQWTGGRGEYSQMVVDALVAVGIDATAVPDLPLERWRKLMWNIPFNGLAIAGGGLTVADVLADEEMRTTAASLMEEIRQAAYTQGHEIPEEFAKYQIERSWSMGAYKPSSLIDWQLGRPVEVEAIWGEAFRRSRAAGVDVPRLGLLYTLLKSVVRGRLGAGQ